MSSSLIVPVIKIGKVSPHPDKEVEKLEVAEVGGWQVVVGKGTLAEGDLVVHFPPDTLLPVEVSDRLGVTQYLSVKTTDNGTTFKGRVRQIKLRGEPSFGFVTPLAELEEFLPTIDIAPYSSLANALADGAVINVASAFQAEKYEPPVNVQAGDAERANVLFERYTDIENLRNFPKLFHEDEEVVITEKIHGANCRIGVVKDEDGTRIVAGSNKLQRRRPETDEEMKSNQFWFAYTLSGVKMLLDWLAANDTVKTAILYGEVYGKGVQSLHYDVTDGGLGFRAFDLKINGKYVNFDEFLKTMHEFGIPFVPVVAAGTFSAELVKTVAEEPSLLNEHQIKEGVVVKPKIERNEVRGGRVILKYLSNAYLFAKGVTNSTDI